MHQQNIFTKEGQFTPFEPIEQRWRIGRLKQFIQGIVIVRSARAASHGQRVKIMIAQQTLGMAWLMLIAWLRPDIESIARPHRLLAFRLNQFTPPAIHAHRG